MNMIKLIGVFDKVISQISTGDDAATKLAGIIMDELCEVDQLEFPCPICQSWHTVWKYRSSSPHRFFWSPSGNPIEVYLPTFSYHCLSCGKTGKETLSTDITIDKTQMSFHYLFELIQLSANESIEIVERDARLYAEREEDSFKRWYRRFHHDFQILKAYDQGIEIDDLLNEQVNFAKCFRLFFLKERRFFMHSSTVRFILPE